MLDRVQHPRFGLGVVLDERRSESGRPISVVVFDAAPDQERVLLSEFVQPSNTRLPAAAKTPAKKTRTPIPEPEKIKDTLLVETPDPYLSEDSETSAEE